MFIPAKPVFDDGQNTQLSGRTNDFTCFDQIMDHLIRNLFVETPLSLVNDYHPVRYFRRL